MRHGFFISFKSQDWALAGRIFDYLERKGMKSFFSPEKMTGRFDERLMREIQSAPFFLLLMTKNVTDSIHEPDDWVRKEIACALTYKKIIVVLKYEDDVEWPEALPEDVSHICDYHIHMLSKNDFTNCLDRIFNRIKNDNRDVWFGAMSWQNKLLSSNNVFMTSRKDMHTNFATLEGRFGKGFAAASSEGKNEGPLIIKSMKMACYADSSVFYSANDKVDASARGFSLATYIRELLKDEDFDFELVMTAPFSPASKEAIKSQKLGNSSLQNNLQEIFFGSYGNIQRLIAEDEVYTKAFANKRLKVYITDISLPYSLFKIEYKEGYKENDHIKVDLYSEYIQESEKRRCMVFFRNADANAIERTDDENYVFFSTRYDLIKEHATSAELIKKATKEKWLEAYNDVRKKEE